MNLPLLTPDHQHEYELRLAKIRSALINKKADGILIASTVNIFYVTGAVFYGYIYIPADGDSQYFIVRPAEVEATVPVESIRKPEQIPAILAGRGINPKKIALEYGDLLYADVVRLQRAFEGCEFIDGTAVMREARLTKTDMEIAKMREDGVHQAAVYSRIDSCWRPDMTDVEFQIEIEHVLRREGCLGYLRAAGSRMELNMGSLIAGDNADNPGPYDFAMGGAGADPSLPAGAAGIIIKPGMSVMVDMNGGFNGYQTDMTRTWFCGSEIPEKALRAHECSRAILRELEKATPGTVISEMYHTAVRMAEAAGLADYFMGHRQKASFIGHGVGIELNEQPVIMARNHDPLEENMTIALEPKFVIPGVGAVGVENTYQVTPDGLRTLTVLDEELKLL